MATREVTCTFSAFILFLPRGPHGVLFGDSMASTWRQREHPLMCLRVSLCLCLAAACRFEIPAGKGRGVGIHQPETLNSEVCATMNCVLCPPQCPLSRKLQLRQALQHAKRLALAPPPPLPRVWSTRAYVMSWQSGTVVVPERWTRQPTHSVVADLRKSRKADALPDRSFDVDGDGVVSQLDYFYAKQFDVDGDGRLNTPVSGWGVRGREGQGVVAPFTFAIMQLACVVVVVVVVRILTVGLGVWGCLVGVVREQPNYYHPQHITPVALALRAHPDPTMPCMHFLRGTRKKLHACPR
jgi:hypothetical protein